MSSSSAEQTDPRTAAQRVARRVLAGGGSAHFYTRELGIAGLLDFATTIAGSQFLSEALALARSLRPAAAPWAREPFGSLTWPLLQATGDQALRDGFVRETREMLSTVWRSCDGLMTHPRGASRGGGEAILLDSGIEHVCRLARAFSLTGEQVFTEECLRQVRGHRDLLRDPRTGLWCQGRGWLAGPSELSPGAWSRGQGWLIHGLVQAAMPCPSGALRTALAELVAEAAAALLPVQDASGLWHALPHRSLAESIPETSGTALIAAGLANAVHHDLLPVGAGEAAARRAHAAVLRLVDAEGVVHGTCPGPGPLTEEGPWLAPSFPPDDPHGPLAVLTASAAIARLDEKLTFGRRMEAPLHPG